MGTHVGKYWETPDGAKRRIYINEEGAYEALGWKFSFYNTGNVCSASVNGETISNASARNLINGLRSSSLYYDLGDGKFHWKQTYNRDFIRDDIVNLIAAVRDNVTKMAAEHMAAGGVS